MYDIAASMRFNAIVCVCYVVHVGQICNIASRHRHVHTKAGVAKRAYIPSIYIDSQIYCIHKKAKQFTILKWREYKLFTTNYVFIRILEPNKKQPESNLSFCIIYP